MTLPMFSKDGDNMSSKVSYKPVGVVNFRDVTSSCPEIASIVKTGVLFRSGHCLLTSKKDASFILDELKMKTVVDLRRSDDEMRHHDVKQFGEATNELRARCVKLAPFEENKSNSIEELSRHIRQCSNLRNSLESKETVDEIKAHEANINEFENDKISDLHHDGNDYSCKAMALNIPLGGQSSVLWFVWSVASWFHRFLLLLYSCFCMRNRVKQLLLHIMNEQSIEGYNRAIIDYSGQQVNRAMQVIALRSHSPILVHCTLGKDRTGLLIALLLRVVGVPMEHILKDYEISDTTSSLCYRRSLLPSGMDESFIHAKRETLINVFKHIDEKYGSLNAYLDSIGFGVEWRHLLCQNILNVSPEHSLDQQ